MDFNILTILSFHKSSGNCIDNTTVACSPEVLLFIINGATNTCRQQDLKFVHVQCSMDFALLVTGDPYPVSMVMRSMYFIKLPQGACGLINGNSIPYNLVSFLGVNNLCTLTCAQVQTDILAHVQQEDPVLLKASDLNLRTANTDLIDINFKINWRILKLARHQICSSVFVEICTGYSNQPQAALDHIKHYYTNGDGNQVCIPVFTNYQRMMNSMRPFVDNEMIPKSVCNALINGMTICLMRIFCKYYPDHSMIHNMNAIFQRSRFPQILTAMQMVEDKVASISAIVRDSIGAQAFTANAPTFASQAKYTFDRYAKGGYSSKSGYSTNGGGYCSDGGCSDSSQVFRCKLSQDDKCLGFQGSHPCIRNKVIVCPNKDKPGICEAYKTNYKEWLERCKKLNKKHMEKSITFDNLSAKDKAKIQESVLASLWVSSGNNKTLTITADSSMRSPPAKKPHMTILVINVVVLSSASLKNPPSTHCHQLPAHPHSVGIGTG
jgi:hypothetical protein